MKARHFFSVLVLAMVVATFFACSSEPKKEEVRFGNIEIVPDSVVVKSAPTKEQPAAVAGPQYSKEDLAKLNPETRRVIERDNELRRKRLANQNTPGKDPLGPLPQPKF